MSVNIYNPTTGDLATVAIDGLEKVSALPSATTDLIDKIYLLTDEQTGYKKGGIYECQAIEVTPIGTEDPSEEGWYELSGTDYVLSADTTVDSSKTYYTIEWVLISSSGDTNIFNGTLAEWEALTPAEQAQYTHIASPDEASEELHNKVYTLLSTSVTTTDTNYTLMLNRKLSDYDYLIIQQLDATSVRNSYIVHLNQFESKRVTLSSLHGANSANASDYSVSTINVRYVDDTTISAYATGSAMINTLEILGVKITM